MRHFISIILTTWAFTTFADAPIISTFSPKDLELNLNNASRIDCDSKLWGGYISFDLLKKKHDEQTYSLIIKDGNGSEWKLSTDNDDTKQFKRLKAPIEIYTEYYWTRDREILLSNIFLEFQKEPLLLKQLSGKLGLNKMEIFRFSPLLFESSDVELKAQFFNNYEAGTSCTRLRLVGAQGEELVITEKSLNQFKKKISLPVHIYEDPICHSSNLQKPENKDKDYELSITAWPTI